MKKPPGKQPTKPNVEKAILTRDIELKGLDKATFTIPIIYRKTFNWEMPEVKFVPINHRCFIIFKGDLESEEYRREMYSKIKLEIDSIPGYKEDRLTDKEISVRAELKEALLAASLKDRYVQVTIPKPDNNELYEILRHDMEELVSELGFEYSTDHLGIHCTFKFPKHDIKYYALEGKTCVEKAIQTLKHYSNIINQEKFSGAQKGINELLYNINRLELLMDRFFSDALNIVWDLPNITCPGYFLWINSCERILDEFQYITQETKNAITNLKPKDIKLVGVSSDIFEFVWTKAIQKSLEFCEKGISTICLVPDEKCINNAFNLINNYEENRQKMETDQSKFIKLFASEDSYFKDPSRAQRLLTASYHLNNIFQASERILGFSLYIAKNTLRIGMFPEKGINKCKT